MTVLMLILILNNLHILVMKIKNLVINHRRHLKILKQYLDLTLN